MKERLLEIGPGGNPAIERPGHIFDGSIDYFALEISQDDTAFKTEIATNKENLTRYSQADSAMMPFPNGSFSHVIMRSVFGEYTMDPQWAGSFIENTHLGLYEVFRVLQPGGRIAIAEECTPEAPATPSQIGSSLAFAGFSNIKVYPAQKTANPHWFEERTKYWYMERPQTEAEQKDRYKNYISGQPIDGTWGYLITADRPAMETETFESTVTFKGIWKANLERDWDHPDNEDAHRKMTFMRAAKSDESCEDEYLRMMIIPGDSEPMDIDTYYERVAQKQIPYLFL